MIPVGKHFTAKQYPANIFSSKGLIIPEAFRVKPNKAKVLTIGDECTFVREGDIIIFERERAFQHEIDGEEVLVMNERYAMTRQTNKDDLELPDGHILIEIKRVERDKLFEKPITTLKGEIVKLVLQLEGVENESKWYEQRMSYGEIIGYAKDVSWVELGDIAILDYTVDADLKRIVHEDTTSKYITVDTRVKYYDHDNVSYANRKIPHDTYEYKCGDVEFLTPLLAVKRGDMIIANQPWVILEYKELDDVWSEDGDYEGILTSQLSRDNVVDLRVLATGSVRQGCVGRQVLIEWDNVFEKTIDGAKFFVALEDDVLIVT
jgi:co-chaperonin GroES (HSP10)